MYTHVHKANTKPPIKRFTFFKSNLMFHAFFTLPDPFRKLSRQFSLENSCNVTKKINNCSDWLLY